MTARYLSFAPIFLLINAEIRMRKQITEARNESDQKVALQKQSQPLSDTTQCIVDKNNRPTQAHKHHLKYGHQENAL